MRLLPAIALALILVPAAGAACPSASDLEDELICPTCKTTLDQSNAPVARQIKDELVADFGPSVLAAPPREGFHWLAWILPLAGLLLAAGVVSVLVWRWSRSRSVEAAADSNGRPPLDPELERRLDRELARYDD